MPLLAHATTAVHDPTDAGACVPAVTVQSAFDGYKSWQDGEAPSWQQLNRAVAPSDLTSTPATQTQPAPGAGFAVARSRDQGGFADESRREMNIVSRRNFLGGRGQRDCDRAGRDASRSKQRENSALAYGRSVLSVSSFNTVSAWPACVVVFPLSP